MKHDQEYIYKDKIPSPIPDPITDEWGLSQFHAVIPPKETFLEKLSFKLNYSLLFLKFLFPVLWKGLKETIKNTKLKVIEYFIIKKALDPKRNKAILEHKLRRN